MITLDTCGLGDAFTSTIHYDATEYFEIDIEEEFRGMREEDNNDPFKCANNHMHSGSKTRCSSFLVTLGLRSADLRR